MISLYTYTGIMYIATYNINLYIHMYIHTHVRTETTTTE